MARDGFAVLNFVTVFSADAALEEGANMFRNILNLGLLQRNVTNFYATAHWVHRVQNFAEATLNALERTPNRQRLAMGWDPEPGDLTLQQMTRLIMFLNIITSNAVHFNDFTRWLNTNRLLP